MRATVAVAAALLAGCGGPAGFDRKPTVPAHVTVTVRGQPAAGAVITFTPVGGARPDRPGARALVGPDEVARLTTYTDGDGAVEGEYDAAVEWPEEATRTEDAPPADARRGKDRLRGKYADPAKAGLRRAVKSGKPDLEPIALP